MLLRFGQSPGELDGRAPGRLLGEEVQAKPGPCDDHADPPGPGPQDHAEAGNSASPAALPCGSPAGGGLQPESRGKDQQVAPDGQGTPGHRRTSHQPSASQSPSAAERPGADASTGSVSALSVGC